MDTTTREKIIQAALSRAIHDEMREPPSVAVVRELRELKAALLEKLVPPVNQPTLLALARQFLQERYPILAKPARRVKRADMSTAHAPKSGITIGDKYFWGGQFIPSKDMKQATDEQRQQMGIDTDFVPDEDPDSVLDDLGKRLDNQGYDYATEYIGALKGWLDPHEFDADPDDENYDPESLAGQASEKAYASLKDFTQQYRVLIRNQAMNMLDWANHHYGEDVAPEARKEFKESVRGIYRDVRDAAMEMVDTPGDAWITHAREDLESASVLLDEHEDTLTTATTEANNAFYEAAQDFYRAVLDEVGEEEDAPPEAKMSRADAGGRWITIGGQPSEDGKRKGGSPVYIVNGRITKGHPSLTGKHIHALSAEPERPQLAADAAPEQIKAHKAKLAGIHRSEVGQSKSYARAVWGKKARQAGIDPKHLHQLAAEIGEHHGAFANEHNAMLREARDALKEFGGAAKVIGATDRIEEAGQIRGMDEVAETIARRYPSYFRDSEHVTDTLFGLLKEGNRAGPDEDDAYSQAFDVLMEHRQGDAWEPAKAKRSRHTAEIPFSRRKADEGEGGLFHEADHPRAAKGSEHGGEFVAKEEAGESTETPSEAAPSSQGNFFSPFKDANVSQGKLIADADEPLPDEPKDREDLPGQGMLPGTEVTPREAAAAAEHQAEQDYEFARESAVPNAGEDLKGSARHTHNAWRGLEDAEKDGTAEELVTRENLLKNEPHNLGVAAEKNPETALAMHLALSKYPAMPIDPEHAKRLGDPELLATARKWYYEGYQHAKETAEELAQSQADPKIALSKFHDAIHARFNKMKSGEGFKLPGQDDPGESAGKAYLFRSAALNPYVRFVNSNSVHTRTAGKVGTINQIGDFTDRVKQHHGELSAEEKHEKIKGHALAIMEGASFNKAFGTVQGKERGFEPTDYYVKHAERKGGPDLKLKSASQAVSHMTEKMKLRGVQWGNYVTDEEREHHATKAAEALTDLADVLKLPPELASINGKLGLAIGARGKGNAAAHYEPDKVVINLTRAGGVGSLAHEWGHFFDNTLAGGGNRFHSERSETGGPNAPGLAGFHKLAKAQTNYRVRLNDYLSDQMQHKKMTATRRDYYASTREVFARCFERYVQRKLHKADRENTYLTGLQKQGHPAWPNDEEVDQMTPAFDAIFAEFGKNKEVVMSFVRTARRGRP